MNPSQLLAHFDRISEAPGAVPRLRRFILDLAVRGKLVEQDPGDEPAEELLKRIASEKAGLEKDGTISPCKVPSRAAATRKLAIGLRPGWQHACLADILLELQTGPFGSSLHQSDYQENGVPVVNPASIGAERIVPIDKMAVGAGTLKRLAAFTLRVGDIVMGRRGEMGRCALVSEKEDGWLCGTGTLILRPSQSVCAGFLVKLIGSPPVRDYLCSSSVGTTTQNLNQAILLGLVVPLPPVREQARIVAKVEGLMALCGRLEAAQVERERPGSRLVRSSITRLNELADKDTFRRRARFQLEALPLMTTKVEDIGLLRDALVHLAVLGQLTDREAGSESADALLALVPRGDRGTRRLGSSDDSGQVSLPDIPETWRWAVLGALAASEPHAITDGPFGANLKTAHYVRTPGYRVVRLQNVGRGFFRYEHQAFVSKEHFERLHKHHVYPGDLVVAGLVDPLVRCCEVPADIGPALVKADCYRFKVGADVSSRFVRYYLNSAICQRFASAHHHGMTLVRIGLGNFRRIPIPLPPLAEQHSIVAKVDELMSLCDRLEEQLTKAEVESARLLEATLQRALAVA